MAAQFTAAAKKHVSVILLLDSGTAGHVSMTHDQTKRRLHVASSAFQLVMMSRNLLVDCSRVRPAVRRGCVVPADPSTRLLSASHVGDSTEHATTAISLNYYSIVSTKPAFVGDVELTLGCCGAFFVNTVTTM